MTRPGIEPACVKTWHCVVCFQCSASYTIQHILIDCTDFAPIRANYYSVDSLKTLFDTVPIHAIISFLKEIALYYKLW